MRSPFRSRWLAATAVILTISAAIPAFSAEAKKDPVSIQILGLNDFHGQLEPLVATATSGGRIGAVSSGVCAPPGCYPAGGVEYLATHVRNLRAENPDNTVFVSAGDLIGATPLLSALFHDEPTIEAFNQLELDYNGVGNHEFDEGIDELLRMQYGNRPGPGYHPARNNGCHPVDGCGDNTQFRGATFDFLAANVTYKNRPQTTIFPPYAIHKFDGNLKVAFIGMTLEGTPLIVSPDGISNVDFRDEAATVNALVPKLQRQGVEAIVVLLHEGGSPSNTGGDPALINSCNNPSGALPPIVAAMDDAVDIVITGHTNWAVNCVIDGKVVTGAASQGRLVTDIDAKIDPRTHDFVEIAVANKIITRDVAPAADLTELVARYNVFAGPIASQRVGSTTDVLNRTTTPAGESTLGRLIADAQLASSQAAGAGGQIAFMNPGGIRQDLDAGDITYSEAFNVQPFSNIVTTKSYTGAQIERLLEQQFVTSAGGTRTLILPVSAGFSYTWDSAPEAVGNRIDPASIMLDGAVIDPAATYRVTMNNFLGSGGDDFPIFREGTDEQTGSDDLVALIDYLGDHDPYTPVTEARITRLPLP